MPAALEIAFERKMWELYERAKRDYGYNATRFLQKLRNAGSVTAAKTVLRRGRTKDRLPKGLIAMVDRGGLDLTVEAIVLQEQWRSLFTEDELATARERLARYGYTFENTQAATVPLTIGEIDDDPRFPEGAKNQVTVNAYERNTKAREACIQHYGPECYACGMTFEDRYGEEAKDFIHVHHLSLLAGVGKAYEINPLTDLRPVCPNCHAVIHLRKPPFTIDEVRKMLEKRGSNIALNETRRKRSAG